MQPLDGISEFPIVRQIVHQVGERFGMHEPMLKRNVDQLLGRLIQDVVDDSPNPPVVSQNLVASGPIGWLIVGSLSKGWVDAKLEQLIELRMEGRNTESLTA